MNTVLVHGATADYTPKHAHRTLAFCKLLVTEFATFNCQKGIMDGCLCDAESRISWIGGICVFPKDGGSEKRNTAREIREMACKTIQDACGVHSVDVMQ
jgi:hypothetical protein